MSESAQSEGIFAIIGAIAIAIVAAIVVFPAIGTATHQDTTWGGTLMILFVIGIVVAIIIGFFLSR